MWDNKSKGLVQIYRRYAGMEDGVYRAHLHRLTGATSSRDAHLTGFHFEAFMVFLEISAHLAHTNGTAVGPRPRRIRDWYYWRHRQRRPGMATWPQLHLIETDLWPKLASLLPQFQRTPAYLLGIAHHATGHPVALLRDLTAAEAGWVIDALRDRLAYASRKTG